MSGTVHQAQPLPDTEEESEESKSGDDLKETGDQYQSNYNEQAPEMAMGREIFQTFAGAIGVQAASRLEVIRAFDGVNGQSFRYNLLNVRDPRKFQQAIRDHALVKAELQKQKGKDRKGTSTKAVVGFSKYRREMEYGAFEKKDQAFQIGAAVQNHVTTEERFIRTKNAFGLDDAHTKQLRDEYANWQTKNKGEGIDKFLNSEDARKIYRKQYETTTPGKKLDEKSENKGISYAYRSDDKSRVEAIKASKDVIKNGKESIDRVLVPGKVYTQEDVNQEIQTVIQPQTVATTPATTPASAQTAATTPTSPGGPAQTATPPVPPPASASSGANNKLFNKFFSKYAAQFNLVKKRLSGFLAKVTGFHLLRTAARNFAARGLIALRHTAFRRFVTASTWGLAKKGIGVALGIGSLGASVAIMMGLEFVKKIPIVGGLADMLEKAGISFIINSVKVIAVLVIAVPLIILFFSIFQGSKLMDQFVSGNQKTVYSPFYEHAENWKNFETRFLTSENSQKITWEQLERNLFAGDDTFLSLDPNRHNQMQK